MDDPDLPCYMRGRYLEAMAPPEKEQAQDGSLSPCVAVREIFGRGKGVVSTEDIPPGTLLAKEKPLIVLPWWVRHTRFPKKEMEKALFRALDELTEEEEELFYSLADSKVLPGQEKTETGIWRTNNFALGRSHKKTFNGLFPSLSRFNHSCVPTAEFHWNSFLRRQEIRSIVRIPEGEEIFLCYFTSDIATRNRDERVKYLNGSYGFECQCLDCSLTGEEAEANDRLRSQVRELEVQVEDLLYDLSSGESDDEDRQRDSLPVEDHYLSLEDLRRALDLSMQRLHLLTALGFKVITRLDAIKVILDIAQELNDENTWKEYFKQGIQLMGLLYSPETEEYREWTKRASCSEQSQ